jgi:hypothetical protein
VDINEAFKVECLQVYINQHAVSQNCFYKNLLFLDDIIALAHAFSMKGKRVFGTVIPPHGSTAGVSLNRSSCIPQVYTAIN